MMPENEIETREAIETYLARVKYALRNGATITFQATRKIDENVPVEYTNSYAMNKLFPNEDPKKVLRRELQNLKPENYLRTVQDTRFPNRSPMREFGKVYNGSDEVYIKFRVELVGISGTTTFVMSFHLAKKPFKDEVFPYKT